MTFSVRIVVCFFVMFLISGCDQESQVVRVSQDATPPPAAESDSYGEQMGAVNFPVSCNAQAQKFMTRGVSLLHHMTYMGAEKEFNNAMQADPDCVLAYWGVAMIYLHPLWPDVTSEAQMARAMELIANAESIGAKTPREAAYLAVVKAYYENAAEHTERERLLAYEAAWERFYQAFPDDVEGTAFFALAHIAIALPDEQGPVIRSEAGLIVEGLLQQQPDHPGAHHYIIHAYDTPGFASQALAVAQNYGKVAPDVPHALHMPTHIFTRLGLWEDSIVWNSRAASASLRETGNETISTEYLHSKDYLAYAYLQIGVQELAVSAWLAYAQGDKDSALRLMMESAAMENGSDKSPVTPGEILPANELLADLQLELGNPAAALEAYRQALARNPNRFNSLFGAATAAQQTGNGSIATSYFQTLVDMTADSTADWPRLLQAREYLDQL